jgi:hypothetical protein
MRLKFVLLVSLVAAVIGAGACVLIVVAALGSWRYALAPANNQHPILVFLAVFVPPWVSAIAAGFFVYRHTAHRRKLQTLITICVAVVIATALIRLLTFYYS